jgi:hypothetical protein
MSNNTKELKLAVLIDADNVPYSNVKGMMEEIAKFGTQLPFMQTGPNQMQEVEKRITRACHYTHTAIQLYGR